MKEPDSPSGFTCQAIASGHLRILHHGKVAAILRGKAARHLLARLAGQDEAGRQHLLARATGDYRRGNERDAAGHPRNQR